MKAWIPQLVLTGLIINISAMYVDDRKVYLIPDRSPVMRPTYRVKVRLYPEISRPKVTIGLSKVSQSGSISPYLVTTIIK